MRSHRRTATLALVAAVSLGAAACSSDDDASTGTSDETSSESTAGDTSEVMAPVGDACSAIPEDGAGSSAGMAEDPAATAAGNNPALSTLVTAVGEAGLVDALNDTSAEYAIFAPVNEAFAEIPEADLEALLADTDALTDVLTYHVSAEGSYAIDELPDELEMLNGGTVEISPDGDLATVNGETMVICGNVQTANATVHLIDSVLMPAEGSGESTMAEPVGPACAAIPADGEGSTAGMADDPAATAAGNNPVLSTLVTAVGAAGLVDTLNDTSAEYTIFAPANDAFAKIPEADLQALLADPAALTDVLTYHVHAGDALEAADLPETLEMVNGDPIEISAEGDTVTINGTSAVICGNVQTANATVHIIDTVLMPPS